MNQLVFPGEIHVGGGLANAGQFAVDRFEVSSQELSHAPIPAQRSDVGDFDQLSRNHLQPGGVQHLRVACLLDGQQEKSDLVSSKVCPRFRIGNFLEERFDAGGIFLVDGGLQLDHRVGNFPRLGEDLAVLVLDVLLDVPVFSQRTVRLLVPRRRGECPGKQELVAQPQDVRCPKVFLEMQVFGLLDALVQQLGGTSTIGVRAEEEPVGVALIDVGSPFRLAALLIIGRPGRVRNVAEQLVELVDHLLLLAQEMMGHGHALAAPQGKARGLGGGGFFVFCPYCQAAVERLNRLAELP